MDELEYTGERLITSLEKDFSICEHLHRYSIAQSLSAGKTVLDIACGMGYGTNLISHKSAFVYGVDIDEESIKYAKYKYEKPNAAISFKLGSTSNIPLEAASVDLVVSFETIEHHDEHEQMLIEIKRVLKPGGILLISSPNKPVYDKMVPDNPFHIKELAFEEFEVLINNHFKHAVFYEQRFVAGSLITPLHINATSFHTFDGDFENITQTLQEEAMYNQHVYSIAICTNDDVQLPAMASLFNGVKAVLKQNDYYFNKGLKYVAASTSFKFGNWFITKFAFFKKKIK